MDEDEIIDEPIETTLGPSPSADEDSIYSSARSQPNIMSVQKPPSSTQSVSPPSLCEFITTPVNPETTTSTFSGPAESNVTNESITEIFLSNCLSTDTGGGENLKTPISGNTERSPSTSFLQLPTLPPIRVNPVIKVTNHENESVKQDINNNIGDKVAPTLLNEYVVIIDEENGDENVQRIDTVSSSSSSCCSGIGCSEGSSSSDIDVIVGKVMNDMLVMTELDVVRRVDSPTSSQAAATGLPRILSVEFNRGGDDDDDDAGDSGCDRLRRSSRTSNMKSVRDANKQM